MGLDNGYGVLIGTIASHYIEPPDAEGNWPHYVINVDTPNGLYECVINLKSRSAAKIEYRDFRDVNRTYFDDILSKPDGLHLLASTPTSGALDVIRHPGLQDPVCRVWPWRWCWCWPFSKHKCFPFWRKRCKCTRWWLESGTDVIQLMEYYLLNVSRIYIFGEPYNSGQGMHNIHMNQGDPISSSFAAENAIWQDGGTILEYNDPQPRLSVFLTKFDTQSLNTNSQGQPV